MNDDIYTRTFYDKFIDKNCKLLIVNNTLTMNKFIDDIDEFMKLKINICAFDLEASMGKNKVIEILQIGLFFPDKLIIIFTNPLKMPKLLPIIRELFTNNKVIKIGHGTESMDVLCLHDLFKNDNDMKLLICKIYDTRLLCEYINTITEQKKSNVYHAIETFNVVDKNQVDFLYNLEKNLGDIWNLRINIYNLSNNIIEYAMYDVVYLKKLLTKIKTKIIELNLDYEFGLQISRLLIMKRIDIITVPNVSRFNNYYFNKSKLETHFINSVNKYITHCDLSYKVGLINAVFKKILYAILQIYYYHYICSVKKVKKERQKLSITDIKEIKNYTIILYNSLNIFP